MTDLESWQERVVEERMTLDLKITNLESFLIERDPEIEYEPLVKQRNIMVRYREILDERIARFEDEKV